MYLCSLFAVFWHYIPGVARQTVNTTKCDVKRAKVQLTIKTMHMQHQVSLLPIGRPLQQWQWIGPCSLRGRAWGQLCLLIGLDESVLQQRLATSRGVVWHKPGEERSNEVILFYWRKNCPFIYILFMFYIKVTTWSFKTVASTKELPKLWNVFWQLNFQIFFCNWDIKV